MAKISIIAAIDENWGIGIENRLLCHLPADLTHFKEKTLYKPIIMGRKTYESIGRPLPKRTNIVLTRQDLEFDSIIIIHSFEEALERYSTYEEIMVIGGVNVFEKALPFASRLYLTHIHHQFKADTFFPKVDLNEWTCVSQQYFKQDEKNAYDMTFMEYVRNTNLNEI